MSTVPFRVSQPAPARARDYSDLVLNGGQWGLLHQKALCGMGGSGLGSVTGGCGPSKGSPFSIPRLHKTEGRWNPRREFGVIWGGGMCEADSDGWMDRGILDPTIPRYLLTDQGRRPRPQPACLSSTLGLRQFQNGEKSLEFHPQLPSRSICDGIDGRQVQVSVGRGQVRHAAAFEVGQC
jgi:hypothetical protein